MHFICGTSSCLVCRPIKMLVPYVVVIWCWKVLWCWIHGDQDILETKYREHPVRTRRCFEVRTTSFWRYGCCMDVKTTSCAYWAISISTLSATYCATFYLELSPSFFKSHYYTLSVSTKFKIERWSTALQLCSSRSRMNGTLF